MTTKIAILNMGPDPILVEPVNRDSDGTFSDGGEPFELAPGVAFGLTAADNSYVHSGRFFTVREKSKG